MPFIQPVDNRILLQFPKSPDSKVIIPDKLSLDSGQTLPFWLVISIGPKVANCKPGDFVFLNPDTKPLAIDQENRLAIAPDGWVMGIREEPAIALTS